MIVPKADAIQTPAQYGAVAPNGYHWPLNNNRLKDYAVNNIYPTVQGEGAQAGTPMTIVRLQGCPVGCVFCDTPESWEDPTQYSGAVPMKREGTRLAGLAEWEWYSAGGIAEDVATLGPRWALVTGGEPTWYNLEALTIAFKVYTLKAALETSGVYQITGQWDWITLSPKPAGIMRMNAANLQFANEIKWLVGRGHDVEALEKFLATWPEYLRHNPVISLQPISCNTKATEIATDALMKHPTWKLSLQTHKYVSIA